MKKNENSYKKSGVNISLANKLVKYISSVSKKNDKKTKNDFLTRFIFPKSSRYSFEFLKQRTNTKPNKMAISSYDFIVNTFEKSNIPVNTLTASSQVLALKNTHVILTKLNVMNQANILFILKPKSFQAL